MNTAIIVAAGSGTRFGSEIPKQYLDLVGKPVIAHTMSRFEACSLVDQIVLVVAEGEAGRLRDIAGQHSVSKLAGIVIGGRTRAESVRNGIEAISSETSVVAVHDGVRPLVPVNDIEMTILVAAEHGAACLTAPMTDTVKEVRNGHVAATIDRSSLRRALTPQAFRSDIIRLAIGSSPLDDSVTDESCMVEALGLSVKMVEGDPRNIKITHPDDLRLAELYLSESAI